MQAKRTYFFKLPGGRFKNTVNVLHINNNFVFGQAAKL